MQIITINLNNAHLLALKALKDFGIYPSRSEAIRVALRDFLKKECIGEVEFKQLEKQDIEEQKKQISDLLRKIERDNKEAESIITY